MNTATDYLVFDGHNDLAFQLWRRQDESGAAFLDKAEEVLAITAHKAQVGHLSAGLFALFVPSPEGATSADQPYALECACAMADILHRLASVRPDKFRVCTMAADIDEAVQAKALAAILHLEGAEPISTSLAELEILYQRGVRSIGPLWSRPNDFGVGVPLTFPGSPDQGPGLTQAGKNLIKACDELNVLIDVSHLNEAGFWDIARLSKQPLIASHSNAHVLCPSPRNLTDKQLDAIAASGGLVGICFATAYLRKDGQRNPDTKIELIIRQLDYLIDRLGEDHVALGSDFDGAVLPDCLAVCSRLPLLVQTMRNNGFDTELIHKLCWQNWYRQIARL